MSSNPPSLPDDSREKDIVFQWPTAVITDYTEEDFLGCAYGFEPPVEQRTIDTFAHGGEQAQSVGSRLGLLFRKFGRAYARPGTSRYNTAIDFAAAVDTLHQQGIAICDFNPENILVTQSELIFVQCDRFALEGESEYHAQSTVDKRYLPCSETLDSIDANQYSDRFALAIYVYQLLLKGYHPFTSNTRNKTSEASIEPAELKQHIGNSSTKGDVSKEERELFADLPKMIRYNLEQCFIEGFETPEQRPSARQWVGVLTEEIG